MLMMAALAALVLRWDEVRRWRGRRAPAVDEVWLLSAIAADLRAGASVRTAIAAAAEVAGLPGVPRMARAGAPLPELGKAMDWLPINGRRVRAALQVVDRSGGRSASVFNRLADRAMTEAALRTERRVLTSQVRMSAAVVAGLPLLSLLAGGAGRIAALATSGTGGLVVAALAVLMQLAGTVLVWRMATG